jgi:hypothetical protein
MHLNRGLKAFKSAKARSTCGEGITKDVCASTLCIGKDIESFEEEEENGLFR